mgnify:CR=1 FL=1
MKSNQHRCSNHRLSWPTQVTGTRFLLSLLIAFFWVGGVPSIGSASPIELTITGTVTGIVEGGWANQPPLANDVSVGQAFTATMVFENTIPSYWYNEPAGENYAEDRYTWHHSLTSVAFSAGGLTGSGTGGYFNYTAHETFTDNWQVSEYYHHSQARQNGTLDVTFASDNTTITNGTFIHTLESGNEYSVGCPPYAAQMPCLLNAIGWDERRGYVQAGNRGTVLANITSWQMVPEPASAGLFALGGLLLLNRRNRSEEKRPKTWHSAKEG